ncbi:MAG TPA: hypothetical protein VMM57_06555 [Bacteroidota bacterium]|nr:hypothetical protein [Bacteroidota bacterium]
MITRPPPAREHATIASFIALSFSVTASHTAPKSLTFNKRSGNVGIRIWGIGNGALEQMRLTSAWVESGD